METTTTTTIKSAPVAFEIDFKENVSMVSPGKALAKIKARLEERRNQTKMETCKTMDNEMMSDENLEMQMKKEQIEEKLMKAKIKRESCRKNKMRVLQELDSQKNNKVQMIKTQNEIEKNNLMNKINQDINIHANRRNE